MTSLEWFPNYTENLQVLAAMKATQGSGKNL